MKTMHRVIYALMALNFIVAAVAVFLAPDQVPVHFGAGGVADRIAGKYELFLLPGLTTVIGLALVFTAHRSDSVDGDKLIKATLVLEVCTTLFGIYMYANALSFDGAEPAASSFNISRGAALVAGIAIVACGNFMPKAERNDSFGIRSFWSLDNEEVWRKSQRFGGYTGIVVGLAIFVCGLALPVEFIMPAMVVLVLVWAGSSIVASYAYSRQHDQKRK